MFCLPLSPSLSLAPSLSVSAPVFVSVSESCPQLVGNRPWQRIMNKLFGDQNICFPTCFRQLDDCLSACPLHPGLTLPYINALCFSLPMTSITSRQHQQTNPIVLEWLIHIQTCDFKDSYRRPNYPNSPKLPEPWREFECQQSACLHLPSQHSVCFHVLHPRSKQLRQVRTTRPLQKRLLRKHCLPS